MSATTRHLPDQASVEFLKKEARDLQKAFRAGDAAAIELISQHLPRAGGLSGDALRDLDLSRQEVQHALAGAYGCAKWEELLDTVRVQDLDALDLLSDRSVQIAMREIDQQDLVRLLPSLSPASADRFYRNMSARVQHFIRTEIELLDPVSDEELRSTQDRVRAMLVELGRQGWLSWEDPASDRPDSAPPDLTAQTRFAALRRPLLELSEEDLADVLLAIAEQARDAGILSLQSLVPMASTLLTEALQYIVDGTEPDLVQDLVETRGSTILRRRTLRGQMAIEGWMSIQSGDNPAIVRIKLETYFLDTSSGQLVAQGSVQVEDLVRRLAQTPLMAMVDDAWADLYLDMAIVARREGILSLKPLLEVLDDDVLRAGMEASIHGEQRGAPVMAAMQTCLQSIREKLKRREAMVVAGCVGIQSGHKPEDLVSVARQAADDQAKRLQFAGSPPAAG